MAHKTQEQDKQLLLALQVHLSGWHLARQKFLVCFMRALLKAQTVRFTRLAPFLSGVATGSNLRRIQRFFAEFTLVEAQTAHLLVALSGLSAPYRLSLDRTHWCFAGRDINILTLALITPHQLAIPVLWRLLPKAGNSNQPERIALLTRFCDLFGACKIDFLVADREFIGSDWMAFLIQRGVDFRVRLRANGWCQQAGKAPARLYWLFHGLPFQQMRHYRKPIWLKGQLVYLSGCRLVNAQGKIDYLIIASYTFCPLVTQDYAQRWQIESLFKALKTAGFHLEDTHLLHLERIAKLLALVAIAFTWAYRVGEWLQRQRSIPLKSHQRRAQSIFRYGLDALIQALEFEIDQLRVFTQLLSCT